MSGMPCSEHIRRASTLSHARVRSPTPRLSCPPPHTCAALVIAAMLQQPRVPPTGQRQAVEVHIKWREVLDYKRELLRCLSIATGWGVDKLDADMQRPLYMRPQVRRCRDVWSQG